MTSPLVLTYDGDVPNGVNPYRPSLNDVGGGAKQDDSQYLPDPVTMFTAADFNEIGKLCVAFGKVTSAAILFVANSGAPAITGLRAAGSVIVAGDFTVIDHGAGDTEITCPATKIMQPFAALGFSQAAGDFRISARVNGTNTGIRIETRNSAGSLADVDFVAFWV